MTLALLAAFAVSSLQEAVWDNPYREPSSEFESRLQDAEFGRPGADAALYRWLESKPPLTAEQQLRAFHQLCGDFGIFTWYRPRQAVCTEETRLKVSLKRSEAGDDDEAMSAAFVDAPSIRAVGAAKVPLTWNAFGSQSADVAVNGVTSAWFVDTGAEITVVTSSLAQRMGIRPLAQKIRVGTTTSDVFGQVGIIDSLTIGTAHVENIPVLILPDAQLKIGNVHQIDGILGLQVFVAFGRMAWVDGGSVLALGEAAPKARPTAPRIYWHTEGLGVPVSTAKGVQGAHLDTGANSTDWRQAGLALLEPGTVAAAKEQITHIGGAGGVIEIKQKRLQSIAFRLGPVPVKLSDIGINATESVSAARIGMDAVSQFGEFILDFEQMRVDGRLKTAAEAKAVKRRELTQDDIKLAPEGKQSDKK